MAMRTESTETKLTNLYNVRFYRTFFYAESLDQIYFSVEIQSDCLAYRTLFYSENVGITGPDLARIGTVTPQHGRDQRLREE